MKRTFAAVLAVCLLLSGCGKREPEGSTGLYGQASGVSPDAVLLTVNGWEVPAARYFYWLTADCDYLARQAGGVPDWNADAGGQTLGEYVKEQALDAAVFYAVVESWADQYGCTLTAEDLSAMDDDWTAKAEVYGGEDAYLSVLADLGLDKAGAQLFSADYYLYEHLRALARTEGSALAPEAGEVEAFAQEAGLSTVEALRFLDEGNAGAALKALQADPSADPARLAQSNSGFLQSVTFAPGDGALPQAAETAVSGLAQGVWSPVTAAEGDFWVLRAVPLDGAAALDAWFDHRLQTAADTAEVKLSEEYDSFTAESFYQGLADARRAEK